MYCIHMHVYTYMYVDMYTHTCIHIHICGHIPTQIHEWICVHTYMYVDMYTHTCMWTHIHSNAWVDLCIHMYVDMYTHTCMWTRIRSNTWVDLCIRDITTTHACRYPSSIPHFYRCMIHICVGSLLQKNPIKETIFSTLLQMHHTNRRSLLIVEKCIIHICGSCGVATISRLLKNDRSLLHNIVSFIGFFCKRDLQF